MGDIISYKKILESMIALYKKRHLRLKKKFKNWFGSLLALFYEKTLY